jgi:two-component system, NarL family, response regulator LiaR
MKNIRIAIIEDRGLTYAGVGAALNKREKFEVVGEAASGMHGLRLLDSTRPDVAIVDIGLPDMDGLEVVRQFRQAQAQSEEAKTKIVVLATHKIQDTMLEAFAAGADSYCIKDSLDKLEEAIRLTYEGNPWIDPSIAAVVAKQVRPLDEDIESYDASMDMDWVKELEEGYKDIFQAADITDQETEIFLLIVQGYDNFEIASQLNMTADEAEVAIHHIGKKFYASFCGNVCAT